MEGVDSEAICIRSRGVLSPDFLCPRGADGTVEVAVERSQVGLAEESRWDSELKNGDEQVNLRGELIKKIDMTRNLHISGMHLCDRG